MHHVNDSINIQDNTHTRVIRLPIYRDISTVNASMKNKREEETRRSIAKNKENDFPQRQREDNTSEKRKNYQLNFYFLWRLSFYS